MPATVTSRTMMAVWTLEGISGDPSLDGLLSSGTHNPKPWTRVAPLNSLIGNARKRTSGLWS